MPCLEISLPRQNKQIKQLLAERLFRAFENSTSYPAETLGIRFLEYDIGETANGGQIWDGRTGKPYIHFVLHIPGQTAHEKTQLIREFTLAFTECLKKPEWQPVIYINEYENDNIGYDGLSLSDHKR